MSIILEGIDMPKDDDFIALEIHKGEYRIYFTKGATIREKRGEAIQIDRPHGRLIDGDKLSIEFENQCVGECADCMFEERCVIIDDIAPTIIESEE